jgi:hypothetical protein
MSPRAPILRWLPAVLCLVAAPVSATPPQVGAGAAHRAHTPPSAPRCEAPPRLGCNAVPSAAVDAAGRLWLTWVADGHVHVARSEDLGATFGPAVRVNPEPEPVADNGENRPKIAIAPDGEVYVSWTRPLEARFSGDIRFSRSVDGGASFSAPVTVNEDRQVISHRFDALAVDPAGRVWLAWLDARHAAAAQRAGDEYRGSALYYAVSEDAGASFGANRKLADHTCQCCRLGAAIDPGGVPVLVWRHIFEPNVRDHALARLDDGEPELHRVSVDGWAIDACPHHGPAISIASDGVYHVVWFTNAPARQGLHYARSEDAGRTFSPPMPLGAAQAAASRPHVLSLGARVQLVWNEVHGEESVLLGMASLDGGASWSAARALARTPGPADHPSLLAHEGRVYAAWYSPARGFRLIEVAE